MTSYIVTMEAAWLVRDAETVDDAIDVAVDRARSRLEEASLPDVEVGVGVTPCPACGEPFDSAYIAAKTALVGLVVEITVDDADGPDPARGIATQEVGSALDDVPLQVIDCRTGNEMG